MDSVISIGFSPCPNDTFMLGALVNRWIDCGEFHFEPAIEDVESLNRRALSGELDVTKMSFSAYPFAANNYAILNAGSALGKNCGPIIIGKEKYSTDQLKELKIAIPGKFTTANFLLGIFFPAVKNKVEMLFSEIENAVLKGTTDAGIIIHESRFTYGQKGLQKICDLGELWEEKTNCPLPLGCIAANRNIASHRQRLMSNLICESIIFAYKNPDKIMPFVKMHAQEMDEQVMQSHIQLYVNNYSLALEADGKKAIELLLYKGHKAGVLPEVSHPVFTS